MSLDSSCMEIKCEFKWTFTCLYIFFLDFIIFRGKWWKVIPCKIELVKRAAWKPRSPLVRHIKSKGEICENVQSGLQLFRAYRDDVICFHKTQFKFGPAIQELQQSASVETSCIPDFRTLEGMLHQIPANHSLESGPSQFSLVPPPEASLLSVLRALQRLHSGLEGLKGE